MGRPKKEEVIDEEDVIEEEVAVETTKVDTFGGVAPLTQEFGNGDLNVLRDKLNEVIRRV